MEHRKVIVYEYQPPEGQKVAVGRGLLLQFGCDFEECQDGVGNYTTAVVEMPDGEVKNVPVEMIVFNS